MERCYQDARPLPYHRRIRSIGLVRLRPSMKLELLQYSDDVSGLRRASTASISSGPSQAKRTKSPLEQFQLVSDVCWDRAKTIGAHFLRRIQFTHEFWRDKGTARGWCCSRSVNFVTAIKWEREKSPVGCWNKKLIYFDGMRVNAKTRYACRRQTINPSSNDSKRWKQICLWRTHKSRTVASAPEHKHDSRSHVLYSITSHKCINT